MTIFPLLDELITALRCLPGVGPKSAQRMAFHLLEKNRSGAERIIDSLQKALLHITHCHRCRNLAEEQLCSICQSSKRNDRQLCIVETPVEALTIEQATDYNGLYFVLMGKLSPLDGIGPEELGLDLLEQRFRQEPLDELILATNTTVESEATAHYIADMAKNHNISITRIAHGIPLGGELEFIDRGTLSHAFSGRRHYD